MLLRGRKRREFFVYIKWRVDRAMTYPLFNVVKRILNRLVNLTVSSVMTPRMNDNIRGVQCF